METKRAQTLETLSKLIQSQRTLLSRTQSDIDRLRNLRNDALTQPTAFLSNLCSELNASSYKLSQLDGAFGLHLEQIDWSLYASHDLSALKTLALSCRRAHSERNVPHTTQRSDLSDLQKLVKEARRTIVDPVLAQFARDSSLSLHSEDEDEIDSEETKRERERAKIRGLKRRKITCGLTISSGSRALDGVFIRRDLEDESGEVDISFDGGGSECEPGNSAPDGMLDTQSALHSPARSTTMTPVRTRRPSSKIRARETFPTGRRKAAPITVTSEGTKGKTLGKRSRDAGKPKSETYKQSWSVSEQHLLERLLEEIPDGEKNRWQKISRAMMGRRTPRQVASRVQKYFEKLKRFGVGVGIDSRGSIDSPL